MLNVPISVKPSDEIILKMQSWREIIRARTVELILAPIWNLVEASVNDSRSDDAVCNLFDAVIRVKRDETASASVTNTSGMILQQLGLATYDVESAAYGIRRDVELVVKSLAFLAEVDNTAYLTATLKLRTFMAEKLWKPEYAHYAGWQVMMAYLYDVSRQVEAEEY